MIERKTYTFRERPGNNTTPITGLVVFNQRMIVSTTDSLYEVRDGKLIELEFQQETEK